MNVSAWAPRQRRRCPSGHNAVPDAAKNRSGFSLIEVMIATAILMGSAIVLSRLAGMGREQSQKARLHSEAQQLCELTMNEVLLKLRPPETVEAAPLIPLPEPIQELNEDSSELSMFAETGLSQEAEVTPDETDPEWRYSLRMDLLPDLPGMWRLTVAVVQGDETLERPIRFSLTRWISGPPPEGAFDELSRESGELIQPDPGGFL
ncbi:MAG: prepilin-type N-terminal cleavage/methylation domain-containing protein [Planctomycetaceae bacterium]